MSWYDLENKITLVTRRTGQSCVTAVQEFAGVCGCTWQALRASSSHYILNGYDRIRYIYIYIYIY